MWGLTILTASMSNNKIGIAAYSFDRPCCSIAEASRSCVPKNMA